MCLICMPAVASANLIAIILEKFDNLNESNAPSKTAHRLAHVYVQINFF